MRPRTSPETSARKHPIYGVADRRLYGIGLMCLGVAIFPLLNASVKYLTEFYPVQQVVWSRYAGHVVFMLLLFAPKAGLSLFRATEIKLQLIRSVLLLTSTVCYFVAIGFIPLATAASISFTSPFIITALSVPLLGEQVGPRRWAAVAVGFIGMLIIVRPGGDTHLMAALVLVSATCYSVYQILTRKVSGRDSAETSTMYAAMTGCLLSSLAVPFYWQMPAAALDWVLFGGLGFFAGLGHFLVVKSLNYAGVSVLAPFGYLQLVGAAILGYIVFEDIPDLWTWVGAAIIVSCGVYISYRERVTS